VLTNILRNVRALPFAILLIFATVLPVMAGPFEDAVAKFANDEFSDTEEAIGVIATGGNPAAFAIISALQDGRLMADLCHPGRRQEHRCRDRRAGRQRSR
jgi:urea transport system permease protein